MLNACMKYAGAFLFFSFQLHSCIDHLCNKVNCSVVHLKLPVTHRNKSCVRLSCRIIKCMSAVEWVALLFLWSEPALFCLSQQSSGVQTDIALAGVCRLVVSEEQWKRKWKMIGAVMCGLYICLDYQQWPPESWSLWMQINDACSSSSHPTEKKHAFFIFMQFLRC